MKEHEFETKQLNKGTLLPCFATYTLPLCPKIHQTIPKLWVFKDTFKTPRNRVQVLGIPMYVSLYLQ